MSTLQKPSKLTINGWPEPVQRVQLLAESGLTYVPSQYVRSPTERPVFTPLSPTSRLPAQLHDGDQQSAHATVRADAEEVDALGESLSIPVLDMAEFDKEERREGFLKELKEACEEWGFFHLKNHGVEKRVMEGVRSAAEGFFELPMEEKERYKNNPVTYQGYGSRMGAIKGAVLDWQDYFFVLLQPPAAVDHSKWPTNPPHWRDMVEKYGKQVGVVFKKLQGALSMSLGLDAKEKVKSRLEQAFGDVDIGFRINYYPPCPQPELTCGLAPHSDPGGLTLLLPDHKVAGLQVKHPSSSTWVTIPPLCDSLVVNLGDQMQIFTNGKYKSVEHRAVVNSHCKRLSIACFLNPSNDTLVAPLPELVPKDELPTYNAMTYKQYRTIIHNEGLNGKAHVGSLASPTSVLASPI